MTAFIRKQLNLLIALIFVISSIVGILMINKGHTWAGDYAQYLMQGRALSTNQPEIAVNNIKFINNNSSVEHSANAYPWGLPLIHSLIHKLQPDIKRTEILSFKFVNYIFYALFLILLVFFYRRTRTSLHLLILFSLFAFNPYILGFYNNILTGIPFLFFSTISILWMQAIIINRQVITTPLIDPILLAFFMASAFFIRTNGILIPCTVLSIAFIPFILNRFNYSKNTFLSPKKNQLRTIIFSIILFIIFATLWRSAFPEGGSSHIKVLERITTESLLGNGAYYFFLPRDFFYFLGKQLSTVVYLAVLLLFCLGIKRNIKTAYPILIYILLTYILYTVWPPRQGLRFLFPILPFLIDYALLGLRILILGIKSHITRLRITKISRLALFILIAGMLLYSSAKTARNISRSFAAEADDPYSEATKEACTYLKQNTPDNAVIIFYRPRVMLELTNKSSVMINKEDSLEKGDYLCINVGVTLESAQQFSAATIDKFIKEQRIKEVFKNKAFSIYKILKQ